MAAHCPVLVKNFQGASNKLLKLMQVRSSSCGIQGRHVLNTRQASHLNWISPSRAASSYTEAFKRSIESPEEFWAEAAENLHWFKKWDRVLDRSREPLNQWSVWRKSIGFRYIYIYVYIYIYIIIYT